MYERNTIRERVELRNAVIDSCERASVIWLIRLRWSMASLNSEQNWADSMLKRAWRVRPPRHCDLSRAASRFVHDSTAREPIKRERDREREREREESRPVDSLRPINTATQTARDVVQFFMTLEMRRRMQRRLRRLHGAGRTTQRGDDKLLGIIAVMCVGALTTQFRRCFIYHGISRCINIYPLAIYTGR